MKYFKISENDVNALIKYLAARPYFEVQQAIVQLQNLEMVSETYIEPRAK